MPRLLNYFLVVLITILYSFSSYARAQVIGFEDIPQAPLDGSIDISYINNEDPSYSGILWHELNIFGANYRVDTTTPGPLYGLPHSGIYALTNSGSTATIETDKILVGLWVGQNEYYGYGAGADQVTIHALDDQGDSLSSVTMDLPDNIEGEAEVLQWMDTRQFVTHSNITSYRIDRREIDSGGGHWVADDLNFIDSAPFPDILINNSDEVLTLNNQSIANLSLQLTNPEDFMNIDADWWLVMENTLGLSYYELATNTWVHGSNLQQLQPSYQGALIDLPKTQLLTLNNLTTGSSRIYFGVDTNMNGSIDFNVLYYDMIEINVKDKK